MPQVSRKPLPKDLYNEIIGELWWVLTNIKNDKEMARFLGDLFTPTEKLMLAKRLAIANLVLRGWNWRDICDFLHVSSSTVVNVKHWLNAGGTGFRVAVKKLKKKEKREEFWRRVDELLPTFHHGRLDKEGKVNIHYGSR